MPGIPSNRLYVGIDIGMAGGLAVLDCHGELMDVTPMLINGNALDLMAISDWVYNIVKVSSPQAYIEKVSAMPGQGVKSMFNFGFNTGALHAIMTTMSIPLHIILPTRWKQVVLVGMDWKHRKGSAVEFCRRMYPDVSLLATPRSRTPHSGMADAICIARFGYLNDIRQ